MMELIQVILCAIILLITALTFWSLIKENSRQLLSNQVAEGFSDSQELVREEMAANRREFAGLAKQARDESGSAIKGLSDSLLARIGDFSNQQQGQLNSFAERLTNLTSTMENRLDSVRDKVENKLESIQKDNNQKLEEMRKTVDEKLHDSLEKRLGESFKQVSERLEQVHKGLGEMQNLAVGVGDLKKVLTNVRARGTLGEVQLESILEQILNSSQYIKNASVSDTSSERVEFAVALPGQGNESGPVLLPIDAKFPLEDFDRLMNAYEKGNVTEIETGRSQLQKSIKTEAKRVQAKYINPPKTTAYAIMFLPTESLFAEVLRIPGLFDSVQHEQAVFIAGPTTLSVMITSLQIGFRTLAIQQRSSEVWQILGAVKTEFNKFGDILEQIHKKLEQASKTIEDASRKSRTIARKLRSVEELPATEAAALIGESEVVDNEEDVN